MVLSLLWGVGYVPAGVPGARPVRTPPLASRAVMPIVDVSQHGEASVLAALVEDDWPRYLVDVGAHDGRSLSNSLPFVELGWSGVLVEPLPQAFSLLADRYASRADVRCVQAACAEG